MNEGAERTADPYIAKLRNARKSPAVLKLRLANTRSKLPNCLVFAFEGDADKAVYYQWVRRIRPDLSYEPFPCEGKGQVFLFREMLGRDLTGLAARVYFFVDRDFDDMADQPEGPDVFMTDRYSVENYLVTAEVVEELLKDEFHCHAEPMLRQGLIADFKLRFYEFLQVTKEINRRLYVARQLRLRLARGLPDAINHLAVVGLRSVAPGPTLLEIAVSFADAPSMEDEKRLSLAFTQLDPATRYRGKFHLLFFMKWLDLLCSERRETRSGIFAGLDKARIVNIQGITIGMLASKSGLPSGFRDFIEAVQ
ncbi:hypothetical protein ACVWXM_002547 [Bradyrhizobium sp. GM7.3]